VHGDSGLGGAVLPAPSRSAEAGHAVDFIIATIGAAPGSVTLVATGPLTNIALAVRREPRLVTWVKDFVIMGGSAGRGNVTPAAEFNIWSDPEAAAIVFGAGWTVRMIGLDVTLQALATPPVRERMRSLGTLGSELLLPALAQYRDSPAVDGLGGPAVHDVCAMVSVASPDVFGYTRATVRVETSSPLTSGMTVTDFAAVPGSASVSGTVSGNAVNASVATSIDAGRFWDLVLRTYGELAAGMGAGAVLD
jgi:purine nucleosidase